MTLMIVFGITLVAFLLVVAGMAVGVIMGRREISGSCGGLANQPGSDGQPSCSLCSNPDAACRELKEAMDGQAPGDSTTGRVPAQNAQSANSQGIPACESASCSKDAIDACKGD